MIEAARSRAHRPFFVPLLLGLLAIPVDLSAQERRATLTLEEAISLARRHNPGFLMQKNDEIEAEWMVREAYGAWLPTASTSMTLGYQAEGTPRFGIFTGADLGLSRTPSYYSSSYSLGLGYRLSGVTLFQVGQQRANRRAVAARSDAAEFTLAADVTRQYLAVLRAQDGVELAEQELARAEENLKLARARVEVGSTIQLEAKRAEVEQGRARVALIQARATAETEALRLFERIGIEFEGAVELATEFDVFTPEWGLDELLVTAQRGHPQLLALRAAENAGDAAVRAARGQYLPTLELSAGRTGYTREAGSTAYLIQQAQRQVQGQRQNCLAANDIFSRLDPPIPAVDCFAEFPFTEADEARIRSENDVFPFRFSREPLSVQLRISLPVFQGFTRQRQLESARVASEDARHRRRAEELRMRADVQAAFRALQAAEETVRLETHNRELADEQLRLERERYRVGASTFLELSEAETIKARADRAYLNAIYGFHESLAALESAVGYRLRPGTGGDT